MPRSRRGFQLQQFLSGNIVPSTAAKPTGVIPEAAQGGLSMQSPPFSAGAPNVSPAKQLESGQSKLNLAGGSMLTPNPAAPGASKFGDLQKALGGVSLGKNLMSGQNVLGSSMLGQDAIGTDWAKLFGYQGMNSSMVSAALKSLGITAPTGGFGANPNLQDWMKQVGLV